MKYKHIFEEKKEFVLKYDMGVVSFRYQENDDKGEFIDQHGKVQSQLYEADKTKDWFVVAGMFMGEIVLKTIPYFRTSTPTSAYLVKLNKPKN